MEGCWWGANDSFGIRPLFEELPLGWHPSMIWDGRRDEGGCGANMSKHQPASGEDWRIAPHFAMCVKSVLKMGWTCHLATCEKNQQLLLENSKHLTSAHSKGASWSSWYATAPRQWKSSLGCSATSSRHSSSPALSIPGPCTGAGAPPLSWR